MAASCELPAQGSEWRSCPRSVGQRSSLNACRRPSATATRKACPMVFVAQACRRRAAPPRPPYTHTDMRARCSPHLGGE
eukprot:142735-Pleurochrysis_carterae.AAC.1